MNNILLKNLFFDFDLVGSQFLPTARAEAMACPPGFH